VTEPVRIAPIRVEHVDGYQRALDSVARERRCLALLEAPPEAECRRFIEHNLVNANPMMVALADLNEYRPRAFPWAAAATCFRAPPNIGS
jgi:hypothetical protein